MKISGVVSLLLLLIGISSQSHSDTTNKEIPRLQLVSFTEIISGNGTVDSRKRLSIRLINSDSELKASYEYLYSNPNRESYGTEPPELDLTTGSAVLLDMGVLGYLGHYILALRATKFDEQHDLTYVTLSPGEECWAPSQMQRPFQLIYSKEKIDNLNTHQIDGYRACKNP